MTVKIAKLPEARKPTSSSNVRYWGGDGFPRETNKTNRTHIVGSYSSSNGQSSNETINATNNGGNIYTSSDGFQATVQTKTSTIFYSQHYIGDPNIGALSGGNITGSSLIGSHATSTQASWMRNVKGFVCEVSSTPIGTGDVADGCGRVESIRISGVFADSQGKVRVYDMCAGGAKITGYTWNTALGSGWQTMSYYVHSNDQLNMSLMGWIVQFSHHKYCGGGTKQKNCTGRVRYLTPLVSIGGGLYTSAPDKWQIIHPVRSWSQRNTHALITPF
jgi:hypothetical protein